VIGPIMFEDSPEQFRMILPVNSVFYRNATLYQLNLLVLEKGEADGLYALKL